MDLVLGDARVTMERQQLAPEDRYRLLVIDAFSSDAIPVHLLTREALKLYREHLRDDGVLAFHASSRYFDLFPVLAALARDAGWACLVQLDVTVSGADNRDVKSGNTGGNSDKLHGKSPSSWVVMGGRGRLDKLTGDARWQRGEDQPVKAVWTDDYSNVFAVFHWEQTAGE